MEPEKSSLASDSDFTKRAKKPGFRSYIVMFLVLIGAQWTFVYFINKPVREASAKYWMPGDKAFRHGDYVTALADYQQFERQYPNKALIHHAVARTLVKMNRIREARSEFNKGMERLPHKSSATRKRWQAERDSL